MNLKERIKSLKKSTSNCRGTALFLSGLVDDDRFINEEDFEEKLGHKTKKPDIGDLVVFRDSTNLPMHAGVIVETEPLIFIYRKIINGAIKNGKVSEYYHPRFSELTVEYYKV